LAAIEAPAGAVIDVLHAGVAVLELRELGGSRLEVSQMDSPAMLGISYVWPAHDKQLGRIKATSTQYRHSRRVRQIKSRLGQQRQDVADR